MKKIFSVATLALLFLSCKKNNNPSDGYFTATINGSSFRAGGAQSFTTYQSAVISSANHLLILDGKNDNQDISLEVYDSSGINSKTYYFNTPNTVLYSNNAEYLDYNKDISHGYRSDAAHVGMLTIRIDTPNRRISGTFSFQAKFELTNETADITNGSFSLPLTIGM